MKAALIINRASGAEANGNDPETMHSAFEQFGVEVKIHMPDSAQLQEAAREAMAAQIDAVIVAGGDGAISTIAGMLAGSKIPLGILPAGTFNHFARDCGIPLKLEDAVQLIATGEPRAIDVAEVNEVIFINNSSVGIYPQAVKWREGIQERYGWRKRLAMSMAFLRAFAHFPLFNVRLATDDKIMRCITPFVFIGNNEYKFDLFNFGTHASFSDGKLSLYTADCTGRLSVIRFAAMALLNRLHQEDDFDIHFTEEVTLETRKRRVAVSVDGEVMPMKPPLRYRIRPRDLLVFMPPEKVSS